ncbi:hypothetical protein F511_07458 [Dorcoceras hygrometricum]|uniref:Calmodulin-binding domain-containing protein n=1 Tax=Dorcoceras hygrometricum TaxID=472368 RepID=A0A2Z7C9U1_9LAMI|nr:hypothetical protein F511_07458 [Dorcoceras hygrometricum]
MAEQRTDPSVDPKTNEVVPRYLRPSSGSCHDLCKYGKKHVFEEKPWKASRRRVAKPSQSELAPVEVFVSGKPKKEKLREQKLSIDTNKFSLNMKLSAGIKSLSPKPKISLVVKTHSPRRNASFGDKKKLPKFKSPSVRKSVSPDPPEVIKREILPPSKQVEVPEQEGSLTDTKLSRNKSRTYYQSDKRSPSLRSNLVKVKVPLSSVENSDGKGRMDVDVNTGRKTTDLKASATKVLKSTAAPSSPRVTRSKRASVIARKTRSSKLASPMKNQNGLLRPKTRTSEDESVPEKTLHVVEMGTRSDSLDSISDDMSRGKSTSLAHDKHDDEIDHICGDADDLSLSDNRSVKNEKVEPVTENGKMALIKSKVILSEDKCRSPVKLKFRSGKVVDLMSDNNNARRLKFRKRNIVGAANSKVDMSTKTYRKIGNNDGATDAKLSSEKVVLKHQDVRGKKSDLLLFNNVIEETASKLVKSRKSKVKALVGAFETVISLQEKTPSSTL